MLGVMWTMPDTFAAVNAELTGDPGLTVSNADCLGRTALDTVDTALAQFLIQSYGMVKLIHAAFHLQMSISGVFGNFWLLPAHSGTYSRQIHFHRDLCAYT